MSARTYARRSPVAAPAVPAPSIVIPAAVRPAPQTAESVLSPVALDADLQAVAERILNRRERIVEFGRKSVVLYLEQGADFSEIAEPLKAKGVWVQWQKANKFNIDSVHRLIRLHAAAVEHYGSFDAARKGIKEHKTLAAACRALKIRMGDPNRSAKSEPIDLILNACCRIEKQLVNVWGSERQVVREWLEKMLAVVEGGAA